jgi:hypothetical protein
VDLAFGSIEFFLQPGTPSTITLPRLLDPGTKCRSTLWQNLINILKAAGKYCTGGLMRRLPEGQVELDNPVNKLAFELKVVK